MTSDKAEHKTRHLAPLGRHVHRVVARGREYFYFQLHRGTPQAGPRIKLADPYSTDEAMRAYQFSCSLSPLRDPRGELRKTYNSAKARCRTRSVAFNLSLPSLERMLVEQNFRCAVSGIPFEQGGYSECHMQPFGISIDRINPNGAYTQDNVRLVCKIANFAMGQWGVGAMEKLAEAVSSHSRKRTPSEPGVAKILQSSKNEQVLD